MSEMTGLVQGHQRLCLLRALASREGYTANDSYLQGVLDTYGLPMSRDGVKTALGWLAEQGLITARTVDFTIVATIASRGLDVVAGRVAVPGVQRPSPEAVSRAILELARGG